MSPLLLHSNTNQYNIYGLLCTHTKMFHIQTCCNHILSAAGDFGAGGNICGSRNFCQFYLVLSLFYSSQSGYNGFIAKKTILILYHGSRGVHYFPVGVSKFFQEGGVQMLILLKPIYVLWGGCPDPLSPSGSAHGQCHHNGTIFITVLLLTIIVRH